MVITEPVRRGFKSLQILCLGVAWAATSAAGNAEPKPRVEREQWYRIELAGQPAGWMHSRETWRNELRTTESKIQLRFRRGDSQQSIEIHSRFEETRAGEPKKAWIRQSLGAQPVEITYLYSTDGITSESEQAGETTRQILPLPAEPWLPPGKAQDTIRDHLRRGSTSFTLSTVDPQAGILPFETRWELVERDVEQLLAGHSIETSRWRQSQTLTPGLESTIHLDDNGDMVSSTTPMMGMELRLLRVSREEALASSEAPELLRETFIDPDRALENPRSLRSARFEITVRGGLPEALPSVGYQQAEHDGDRAEVSIDLDRQPPAEPLSDKEKALYLRPTTFLQHEDSTLRGLHGRLAEGLPEAPGQRAEFLRRFVERYLEEKNLDSVLATASEAASSKAGDCTEHSVLLAALLRADGIPSRVVAGLIYVEDFLGARDFFGYHMWTQAHLDGRWIDLDATLSRPFDAAHIAFVTSALADDGSALADLGRIGALIGRSEIRILEPGEPKG